MSSELLLCLKNIPFDCVLLVIHVLEDRLYSNNTRINISLLSMLRE